MKMRERSPKHSWGSGSVCPLNGLHTNQVIRVSDLMTPWGTLHTVPRRHICGFVGQRGPQNYILGITWWPFTTPLPNIAHVQTSALPRRPDSCFAAKSVYLFVGPMEKMLPVSKKKSKAPSVNSPTIRQQLAIKYRDPFRSSILAVPFCTPPKNGSWV